MGRITRVLGALVIFIAALVPQPAPIQANDPNERIEFAVLKAAGETRGGIVPVIVQLRAKADLRVASAERDPLVRKTSVVRVLQQQAATSQAPLLRDLTGRPGVRTAEGLWSANVVLLTADLATIQAVAARPEVERISLDRVVSAPQLDPDANVALTDIEPNLVQIKADQVWNGLGVTGQGTVVAIIDTGVDMNHPALRDRYRGRGKPDNEQAAHWFSATGENYPRPVDNNGHGTHVAGIAVGDAPGARIGVAPGAQWIAAKAFDDNGAATESALHRSLQWTMAPGGDPANAPDVVNNSWGTDDSFAHSLAGVIASLRAAGIMPVFAMGNSGPFLGSINSPASDTNAFAVGAVDGDDVIALFSSRGPGPFGGLKPDVVAPGVRIRSAKPGGDYQFMRGTSQATPHVAGAFALLRSLHPGMSNERIAEALRSTAAPLGNPPLGPSYGNGRIDVLRAALLLAGSGVVTGKISGSSGAVENATVVATVAGSSERLASAANAAGDYRIELRPGRYDLIALAPGYRDFTIGQFEVIQGQTVTRDVQLTALPRGALTGRIRSAATGAPVNVKITIGAFSAAIDPATGQFRADLPEGKYDIRIEAVGYRIVRGTVDIVPGREIVFDRELTPAPRILLVDTGAWYNDRRIRYVRAGLEQVDLLATEKIITERYQAPTEAELLNYDVVIWLAPQDAPGLMGGIGPLTGYLKRGGRLLISGQDIGYWDGGGSTYGIYDYYHRYLQASWRSDDSGSMNVRGVGPFADLSFSLNHPDSARNQRSPDVLTTFGSRSAAAFAYSTGAVAGIRADLCLPYRVLYLGFGIEGVGPTETRAKLLDTAITWLVNPGAGSGIEVTATPGDIVAAPGEAGRRPVRLWNTGLTTDTVRYSAAGSNWEWSLRRSGRIADGSITLGPCEVADVDLQVRPAWDARSAASEKVTVTFQSGLSTTISAQIEITGRTPAPILLVDHSRFYKTDKPYRQALDQIGIPYDVWTTESHGPVNADLLDRYGAVIWFTGYDWYAPVTRDEQSALSRYLAQGGRLFLSSQDLLDTEPSPGFVQQYLGVIGSNPVISVTQAAGIFGSPVGDGVPLEILKPPYPNYSGIVSPTEHSVIAFQNDQGYPIGVLSPPSVPWRTAFLGFGLEGLSTASINRVLRQTVDWFGPGIAASFRSDRETVRYGDQLTLGIVVEQFGSGSTPVTATVQLPPGVSATVAGTRVQDSRLVQLRGTAEPGRLYQAPIVVQIDSSFRQPAIDAIATIMVGNDTITRRISIPVAGRVYLPNATRP